jgi:low affinity Fe/Cu permease
MRAGLPVRAFGSGHKAPQHGFGRFANAVAHLSGKAATFMLAVAIVLIWAVTGPLFHFSDTWQLVINTGTTIVTFLMVFLIQNTQNRDTLALQLKLDELIIAMKGARNEMACIEDESEEELEKRQKQEKRRARRAESGSKQRH